MVHEVDVDVLKEAVLVPQAIDLGSRSYCGKATGSMGDLQDPN